MEENFFFYFYLDKPSRISQNKETTEKLPFYAQQDKTDFSAHFELLRRLARKNKLCHQHCRMEKRRHENPWISNIQCSVQIRA